MKATGLGGGWRNQAAANYLGPSRALPADCFSRAMDFRVRPLWLGNGA